MSRNKYPKFATGCEEAVIFDKASSVRENDFAISLKQCVNESGFGDVVRSHFELLTAVPEFFNDADSIGLSYTRGADQQTEHIGVEDTPRGFHPNPTLERPRNGRDT